jgi:hypothetical protein
LSSIQFPPTALNASPSPSKHKATPTEQAALNRSRCLHLYEPTQDTLTNRALDLASQIGIAVSHIDHEIADSITRDRLHRLFDETS